MRIAIFTDLYAPWAVGGIPSSVKAQKDELEKLGHEVIVFCPGVDAREKNVINVPTCRVWRINKARLAKRPEKVEEFVLEKVPNFAEFDVVHVHYEAECSIAGVRLARRFGIPLVQTMHGREDMAIAINVPRPWKKMAAKVLCKKHAEYLPHLLDVKRDKFQAPTKARAKMWELMVNQAEQADMVMAPSDHFARKLMHYGVTKPLVVVSNGVSTELLKAKFPVRKMQDGDVLKMIWNSRVSREKRMMPFLEALTMLERPYLLAVYGEGNDFKKAQRFAKKHDLKVKFYGQRKRVKILERMGESHLGVMTSYNFDTQGMTLLEAEATGLPVLFCDPAMVEVVPSDSFVLAGGPEPEAIAITLNHLPAEQIEKMSQVMLDARGEVAQAAQIKNLLKVYEQAIANRRVRQKAKRAAKTAKPAKKGDDADDEGAN